MATKPKPVPGESHRGMFPEYQPLKPSYPYLQPAFGREQTANKISSTPYMQDFLNYYNQNRGDVMGLMGNWGNIGQAGLGMYDLGNAGMGQYGSQLLGDLTNRVSSNLADPNASLAMGMAKDRMAGSELSQRQGLADRFAGWGRGSGIRQAAEAGLTRDMGKTAADTYRQIAMDTEKEAIANAMGLEGMKGGFYENAMGRELQNRMGQGGFYDTSKTRELQNAGLNKEMLLGMGGLLGGGMGQLGNMEQWAGNMDVSERDKYLQNLLGFYNMDVTRGQSNTDKMNQYQNDLWRYNAGQYYGREAGKTYYNPNEPYKNPYIKPQFNGGMMW